MTRPVAAKDQTLRGLVSNSRLPYRDRRRVKPWKDDGKKAQGQSVELLLDLPLAMSTCMLDLSHCDTVSQLSCDDEPQQVGILPC